MFIGEEVENSNHDDSDATVSDQDTYDVVRITLPDDIFDVKKRTLAPIYVNGLSKVIC
jgi:hypothetical protein